ncbi:MAG: universal stress protein [Desulfobacterales bacterium]|nr:universal stress protein [Desulfobacterales bacterium]
MNQQTKQNHRFNKNILIAVDESENSQRAVSYVGQMLGGVEGFTVTVLNVINEPEEDFFPTEEEKQKWLKEHRQKIDEQLAVYKQQLVDAGFDKDALTTRSILKYCPSMAQCILAERDEKTYSTIVVGRQGLSRSEEFLFGSISSKIVNHAKNCTVWVVE